MAEPKGRGARGCGAAKSAATFAVSRCAAVGYGDNLQIFPRNTLRETPHATDIQSIAFSCLQMYCDNLQMYCCSLQM